MLSDDHYQLPLLQKIGYSNKLSNNLDMAQRRLISLKQQLDKDNEPETEAIRPWRSYANEDVDSRPLLPVSFSCLDQEPALSQTCFVVDKRCEPAP